jgi:zinc transport system substrate-binding protein
MESFMPRLLDSLENKNKAVSLIQTQGLKLLPIRAAGDNHNDHDHDEHEDNETDLESSRIDAHFWLDTHNADILVDAISRQIIRLDPEHEQQYLANSQLLHDQIALLRKTLQQSLSTIKTPFLTYHDGFQYFETEFALNNAGFITSSELQPGARHIIDLKKIIKEKNIECIFYDAPAKPAMLKSLLAGSQARTFMLDPVGISIPPGENNWFDIMHSLSKQFINCQQHL